MKLIGAIASPYVTRVVMFARLKGVDLPLEGAPGGSSRSDEYLAMTPIGKIPSLLVRRLVHHSTECDGGSSKSEGGNPSPRPNPVCRLGDAGERTVRSAGRKVQRVTKCRIQKPESRSQKDKLCVPRSIV